MNQQEFNKRCAGIMGYEYVTTDSLQTLVNPANGKVINYNYNPYTDLNQLAEVVEKLAPMYHATFLNSMTDVWRGCNRRTLHQCLRDFIVESSNDR